MPRAEFDPDRLYTQLNRTQVGTKDKVMYQLLYQMIGAINKIANLETASSGGGGGGGGSSIVVNNSYILGNPNAIGMGTNLPMIPSNPACCDNPVVITITNTGTLSDFNFGNANIINCDNASALTITGLKAGAPGQRVVIVSKNGIVGLTHEATSSSQNQLTNWITSGITPLAGGSGAAEYEYDAATAKWKLIWHSQGEWITPDYDAGRFTGSGAMTWDVEPGDVQVDSYFINGKVFTITLVIDGSSVGGTPDFELLYELPNSYIAAFNNAFVIIIDNAGAGSSESFTFVDGAGNQIHILADITGSVPWGVSVDLTNIYLTCYIPLQ